MLVHHHYFQQSSQDFGFLISVFTFRLWNLWICGWCFWLHLNNDPSICSLRPLRGHLQPFEGRQTSYTQTGYDDDYYHMDSLPYLESSTVLWMGPLCTRGVSGMLSLPTFFGWGHYVPEGFQVHILCNQFFRNILEYFRHFLYYPRQLHP